MTKDLGKRVRRFRQLAGLTQYELADLSGLSFRAIQRVEDGSSRPRSDTIEALAKAMKVSVSALLVDEGVGTRSSTSADLIERGPTALDLIECMRLLVNLSPERRAAVLGILFDDHSFFSKKNAPMFEAILAKIKPKGVASKG